MTFSKFIKLVTHFVRFPVDIFLWPISVVFGWYHGIIKLHAMITLNETTWGSRAGADASDSERMIRQDQKLYEQHLLLDEKTHYLEKPHFTHDFTNTQALAA